MLDGKAFFKRGYPTEFSVRPLGVLPLVMFLFLYAAPYVERRYKVHCIACGGAICIVVYTANAYAYRYCVCSGSFCSSR